MNRTKEHRVQSLEYLKETIVEKSSERKVNSKNKRGVGLKRNFFNVLICMCAKDVIKNITHRWELMWEREEDIQEVNTSAAVL